MADAPKLSVADLRTIITDATELTKGTQLFDAGGLSNLGRYEHKLYADAQGSTTYKVQAIAEDKGWRGRCSCMAARSRPICKHAAALLVAWQRTPDAFAVADAAPPGLDGGAKKKVKAGKVDAAQLMATGVGQVVTLVRELAIAGAAALAEDRPAQIRALGENLREHKLRRLSARTIALADLLDAKGPIDEVAYAELLGELLLTARKLDKHLAGEPLEDRHVEELIGKTWTKKDRAAIAGLDLIEVAFLHRETADNFVIRESRFVDAATGVHYSEKQILPAFLVKRTPAKLSYAGLVLRGAGGGLYPGYGPRRVDLEAPGVRERLSAAVLAPLVAHAVPTVKDAVAALAEHKKDLFAPDTLPIAIACDTLIADRGRLQLADATGAAIFLADDDAAADRLATALASTTLAVVIGDLGLDGALPTLTPLAVVISGRAGLELRSIAVARIIGGRKVKVALPGAARPSSWAPTARALGLSAAAIALGELREELAGLLHTGLPTVTTRRVEPLATRLAELGLAKPADLLRALAARPDPGDRLDDLIKLHQVLGVALARLASAVHVDRGALAASPMYASVHVRRDQPVVAPTDLARQVARGEVTRFEAGALAARYYETQDPTQLITTIYPTWADGSASPFIALAATHQPANALAAATAVLATATRTPTATAADPNILGIVEHDGARFTVRIRAAVPRMASLTALRVLEALATPEAVAILRQVERGHRDHTIRTLATAAAARITGQPVPLDPRAPALRDALLNAGHADERAAAATHLAEHADLAALPYLRLAFAGDISQTARDAAGRALGRLGDADSVDTFCAALHARATDHDTARTAAAALGSLGDVRGLDALVTAYRAAWLPDLVSDALTEFGPAAIPALLEAVEEQPTLLKRATAHHVFNALRGDDLLPALRDRVTMIAAHPDFVERATVLLDLVKDRSPLDRELGAHILATRPELKTAKGKAERALLKKAGVAPAG
jgi:hypothetical protein